MPVAKSYEQMTIQGEPFNENGKMYVNVLASKGIKKVRWYSETEYKRMYPDAIIKTTSDFNARYAFGFREEGFITIYKGNEEDIRAWAQAEWPPKAWYNLLFHFYTPGFMPIINLPKTITPIKLTWNEVKVNDTQMKPNDEVSKYVLERISDVASHTSMFQGAKDEWLQKIVTITKKKSNEGHFGTKHTYNLMDVEGNTYIWETGAKDYPCNASFNLKMKVKDHKEIDGEKVTIVWYCKEV